MRRTARLLTVFAVVTLALAPALAHAQAGRGGSMGSRGARTYQAPPPTQTAPRQARPLERTNTQPGTAAQPGAAARPNAAAPAAAAARPGFFQRNPFMGGMMMGLLGAGLIGMLAGGGFFSGLGSLAGVLGFLLQIALIAGLVFLVVALVRRLRQPQGRVAPAGVPAGMMAREMQNPAAVPMSRGGATRPVDEVGIGPADYQAFERVLLEVQAAWSRADVAALQRLATPEMVQFFREDGAALHARGLANEVSDVKLEQGDLAEAWNEGARDYATVAMRFSYVTVTRELATGRVVEGDPNARVTRTELWTFVRVQGGPWTLSAIQQAG
jgi:predicted lipid-binding transport protein (Tim44 family)